MKIVQIGIFQYISQILSFIITFKKQNPIQFYSAKDFKQDLSI